ncbi:MAG TPA: hypothetical protein VJ729_03020 [Nitrososphaeraceae archaeon]|nr:hypothetical protein [Nitrososphaeraceae archaeon]
MLTEEFVMMPHNKEKIICHVLLISITILMLGYSSVFAFPFQSAIHHHKVFDKKQVSTSSIRSSDAKGNSNNNDDNNKKNNQATNDGSNTNPGSNLQSVETDQEQRLQQGTGESISSVGTATTKPTPAPQSTCEQQSNCTDQQGFSDRDRSSPTTSSAGTSGQDNNMPFLLPFP